jgi:hypothetical protein
MPEKPDGSSVDPESTKLTLSDHLWWIVEAIGIIVCVALWLVTRNGTALAYAVGSVALLGLVFHLSRYASRRSTRAPRR